MRTPSNQKLTKNMKKSFEVNSHDNMIKCSKSMSAESTSYSTTSGSEKETVICKTKKWTINQNHSFEFISVDNNYQSLYEEKCYYLQQFERKFNELNQEIIDMINKAKEINNSSQQQINNLKELITLIMCNYNEKRYETLNYINEYFNKNISLFCNDTPLNDTFLTDSNYAITLAEQNKNKNITDVDDCDHFINYDKDFWKTTKLNTTNKHNSYSVSKKTESLHFFITKELKEFLNEKFKSFLLK